ncbi:MAG TPA: glycosyltransferase family 4 protein [Verrucomicrobiae bacterium]|jgi:glycosyltransferase involved in cell wall biosynthesis|nr:glycosyltransferase family 4 protein [Verrucomicrobiae bacterium]
MALNIVHFSQDFSPGKAQLGGYSRIYHETDDKENNHIIFTSHMGENGVREEVRGHLRIVSIGVAAKSLRFWNKFYLAEQIARGIHGFMQRTDLRPDLLFGHSQLFNFHILDHLKKLLSRPVPLLWEANGLFGLPRKISEKWRFNPLARIEQKIVFEKADVIIAQTEAAKDAISRSFGIAGSKIHAVTNGADADYLGKYEEGRYAAARRPFKVLFIGLLDTMNGITFLLRLLETAGIPGFSFSVVGSGEHQDRVIEAARKKEIDYKGQVSHSEVSRIMAQCDFLIIPRLRFVSAEYFIPTKLLEAMAMGKIVIGSDVGGISQVLSSGNDGFLFKAEEPLALKKTLQQILEMPAQDLEAVSRRARQKIIDHYLWSSQHKKLASVYGQWAGRHEGAASGPQR